MLYPLSYEGPREVYTQPPAAHTRARRPGTAGSRPVHGGTTARVWCHDGPAPTGADLVGRGTGR